MNRVDLGGGEPQCSVMGSRSVLVYLLSLVPMYFFTPLILQQVQICIFRFVLLPLPLYLICDLEVQCKESFVNRRLALSMLCDFLG